jgi:hypothetical protein
MRQISPGSKKRTTNEIFTAPLHKVTSCWKPQTKTSLSTPFTMRSDMVVARLAVFLLLKPQCHFPKSLLPFKIAGNKSHSCELSTANATKTPEAR